LGAPLGAVDEVLEAGFYEPPQAARITFGGFVLDGPARTLRFRSNPVALRPKEFDVLAVLARCAGKLVTKDQLIAGVWPSEEVSDAALTQTVYRLRRTLSVYDPSIDHIITIPGQGYQFVAAVSVSHAPVTPEVCEEAFRDFRRAVALLEKPDEESVERSICLLEDALRDEPEYVGALVALAEAYVRAAQLHVLDSRFAYSKARGRAARALQLDPLTADGLAVWSQIALVFERDLHAALHAANTAVALAPHAIKARTAAAWACIALTDHESAAAHAKQAIDLDPSSAHTTSLLGIARYFAGRFEEARVHCDDALEMDRTKVVARYYCARALCALGTYDEALAALYHLGGALSTRSTALIGYIAGRMGDEDEQLRALSLLSSAAVPAHVSTALVLLGSNRQEEALVSIRAAAGARDPELALVRVDPLFAPTMDELR
jgi:DNA-binding winged helix-turn-helix (wHTH) protein